MLHWIENDNMGIMQDRGNIVIRRAVSSDLEVIARLEIETSSHPWSKESLLHDISESDIAIVVVAEEDEEILGYADVWNIAGEGQLNNIAVFSRARGRHIGQALMETLFDILNQVGSVEMSLEVRKSNIVARTMYEKLGFISLGIRPGYYEDNNEDAIIYRKELGAC